jgi:hypothetical protein
MGQFFGQAQEDPKIRPGVLLVPPHPCSEVHEDRNLVVRAEHGLAHQVSHFPQCGRRRSFQMARAEKLFGGPFGPFKFQGDSTYWVVRIDEVEVVGPAAVAEQVCGRFQAGLPCRAARVEVLDVARQDELAHHGKQDVDFADPGRKSVLDVLERMPGIGAG